MWFLQNIRDLQFLQLKLFFAPHFGQIKCLKSVNFCHASAEVIKSSFVNSETCTFISSRNSSSLETAFFASCFLRKKTTISEYATGEIIRLPNLTWLSTNFLLFSQNWGSLSRISA